MSNTELSSLGNRMRCPRCHHPEHAAGTLCGDAITETYRDDVGFGWKPTGREIVDIVDTCKCTGKPAEPPPEHANGAKSVIARALGGKEPSDGWYEAANEVLDELRVEGYLIVHSPSTERVWIVWEDSPVGGSVIYSVHRTPAGAEAANTACAAPSEVLEMDIQ